MSRALSHSAHSSAPLATRSPAPARPAVASRAEQIEAFEARRREVALEVALRRLAEVEDVGVARAVAHERLELVRLHAQHPLHVLLRRVQVLHRLVDVVRQVALLLAQLDAAAQVLVPARGVKTRQKIAQQVRRNCAGIARRTTRPSASRRSAASRRRTQSPGAGASAAPCGSMMPSTTTPPSSTGAASRRRSRAPSSWRCRRPSTAASSWSAAPSRSPAARATEGGRRTRRGGVREWMEGSP